MFQTTELSRSSENNIYHFSDESKSGYGQTSYFELINKSGKITCYLVMGKAHVSTLKYITIPRIELVVATLFVKVSAQLQEELNLPDIKDTFWTANETVLD